MQSVEDIGRREFYIIIVLHIIAIESHYRRDKADTSPPNISNTRQLALKQSRLIDGIWVRGQTCANVPLDQMCPFRLRPSRVISLGERTPFD